MATTYADVSEYGNDTINNLIMLIDGIVWFGLHLIFEAISLHKDCNLCKKIPCVCI
jgi:hypothetical protein